MLSHAPTSCFELPDRRKGQVLKVDMLGKCRVDAEILTAQEIGDGPNDIVIDNVVSVFGWVECAAEGYLGAGLC